ncbi:DUF4247 domain-containing protein [Antrihabitans sp. YC2-6]|nr:DUF4247 domain-containing protein [Antrihabitans sp. YC2-6]
MIGAVCAALLLGGCSEDEPRDFVGDLYDKTGSSADTVNYHSDDPVDRTVSKIAAEVNPAARATDGANQYLRYDDEVIIVSPATPSGSNIVVEDVDAKLNNGAYSYLGPGFTPASAAQDNEGGK